MAKIPKREQRQFSRRALLFLLALTIGGSATLIACNKKASVPEPAVESETLPAPPTPAEAPKASAPPAMSPPANLNAGLKIENDEEKIGPFIINGKRLTVVLKYRKASRNGAENDKTVEGFEVRDDDNTLYHQETFGAARVNGASGSFESNIKMKVFKLEGESGEGLIAYYDIAPNAPPAGPAFQVFGLNGEKIEPISSVISVYGAIDPLPGGGAMNALRLLPGDLIQIHQSVDHLYLRIPFAVDFKKSTVKLAQSSGLFDFEAPGQTSPERGEVQFFSDYRPGAEKQMLLLEGGEKIKLDGAYAEVRIKDAPVWNRSLEISNLWLKVTIGEKEGWITSPESYRRIGLQG